MDKASVRWAMRRGMLELDLLLPPFFEAKFDSLSAEEKETLLLLLKENDQDLYAWILNFLPCTQVLYQPLLKKIRQYHALDQA